MDGYRRLARTRGVQSTDAVDATAGVRVAARRRRRPSIARAAGALRLIAFVGVLVIIVGTSVGLASSDNRGASATPEPVSKAVSTPDPTPARDTTAVADTTPVVDTTPVEPTLRASSKAEDSKPTEPVAEPAAAEVEPAPEPAVAAAPASASATGATPTRALPFTGPFDDGRLLLAGALFVLVGMLVQVAGQPLPARAHARR